MPTIHIERLQSSFARVFFQRCFYLFISLIVLLVVAPFAETTEGRIIVSVAHVFVLISAVAAVGRTTLPFIIALLLGLPALGFRLMALLGIDDVAHESLLSMSFMLGFYVIAIAYLLIYVFSEDVMTDDKLFGAAAAYLMLGIAWALGYDLMQRADPATLGVKPGEALRPFYDLLYMSIGFLTSNGPGDMMVYGAKARVVAMLEQIFGVLYVAILIARLAGIYPPKRESQ